MSVGSKKNVPKIRTRTGMAHEASKPHCNYITLASLELKRTMCDMVRTAARGRVAEMEKQLAEIDRQQAEILGTITAQRQGGLVAPHAFEAADATEPPPARFTLRY
jgi:hypothetical protein